MPGAVLGPETCENALPSQADASGFRRGGGGGETIVFTRGRVRRQYAPDAALGQRSYLFTGCPEGLPADTAVT